MILSSVLSLLILSSSVLCQEEEDDLCDDPQHECVFKDDCQEYKNKFLELQSSQNPAQVSLKCTYL